MSIVYTRQYRPIKAFETNVNAGITTRMMKDLADGINNYKAYAGRDKLVSQLFPQGLASDKRGWYFLPPRFLPDGYDHLVIRADCYSGEAEFAFLGIYLSPERIDNATAMEVADNPIVSSATTYAGGSDEDVSIQMEITDFQRSPTGLVWPFFFWAFSGGLTSKLYTLEIIPYIS